METNKLNLQHYFRALKEFSIPSINSGEPSYNENVEHLEQILRDKGVPDVVEYVKNDLENVTLVYQDPVWNTTCVEIQASGQVIAKDSYCTREKWKEDMTRRSLATTIFAAAVPGSTFKDMFFSSGYPKNSVLSVIRCVSESYFCLSQSQGNGACLQKAQMVNTQTTQKLMEELRSKTDDYWGEARNILESAKRREGLFSDVESEPIKAIIDQYAANPYEGLTPLDTIRGRTEKAKKMVDSIRNTVSSKAIIEEEKEERKTAEKEKAWEAWRRKAESECGNRHGNDYYWDGSSCSRKTKIW